MITKQDINNVEEFIAAVMRFGNGNQELIKLEDVRLDKNRIWSDKLGYTAWLGIGSIPKFFERKELFESVCSSFPYKPKMVSMSSKLTIINDTEVFHENEDDAVSFRKTIVKYMKGDKEVFTFSNGSRSLEAYTDLEEEGYILVNHSVVDYEVFHLNSKKQLEIASKVLISEILNGTE